MILVPPIEKYPSTDSKPSRTQKALEKLLEALSAQPQLKAQSVHGYHQSLNPHNSVNLSLLQKERSSKVSSITWWKGLRRNCNQSTPTSSDLINFCKFGIKLWIYIFCNYQNLRHLKLNSYLCTEQSSKANYISRLNREVNAWKTESYQGEGLLDVQCELSKGYWND